MRASLRISSPPWRTCFRDPSAFATSVWRKRPMRQCRSLAIPAVPGPGEKPWFLDVAEFAHTRGGCGGTGTAIIHSKSVARLRARQQEFPALLD